MPTRKRPPRCVLADYTSLRVGGSADELLVAGTRSELIDALRYARLEGSAGEPPLILGAGSNIVISDRGHPGVVIRADGGRIEHRSHGEDETDFFVDAGVRWDDFVAETVRLGCSGVEMMSGIPGSVGAAPMQNINAYGQQIATSIISIQVIDRSSLTTEVIPAEECGLAFRTSRFKTDWSDRYVVSGIHCRLPRQEAVPPAPSTYADIVRHFEDGGSPTDVGARRNAVLAVRRRKSMLLDPGDPNARSVGSFFINPMVPDDLAHHLERAFDAISLRPNYPEGRDVSVPPGYQRIPAAHVLRASGFNRSDSWGPIALSDHHVLALVTRPGARADDVWLVGNLIRDRVRDATGVLLAFEARFFGTFPEYDRRRVEREYTYRPGPSAEPSWMSELRQ